MTITQIITLTMNHARPVTRSQSITASAGGRAARTGSSQRRRLSAIHTRHGVHRAPPPFSPPVQHFTFPSAWIAPALIVAAAAFGPLGTGPVRVTYRNLDGEALGTYRPPATIIIDKRGSTQWTRSKARCVLAHEYGHLTGAGHSGNPRSIMHPVLTYPTCRRWLDRHDL